MFDEEDDESKIPFHLHLFQILIYCIIPAIVIIFTQVMKDDRSTAIIVAGLIAFGINFLIQLVSYFVQRRSNLQTSGLMKVAHDSSEDESCFGKKAYLFLFPARSSFWEVICCVVFTGVYTSLMTYFLHN